MSSEEFLVEEFKSLRGEIATKVEDNRKLEYHIVLVSAAVYSWMASTRVVQPAVAAAIAVLLLFFTVLCWSRNYATGNFVYKIAQYVKRTEAFFMRAAAAAAPAGGELPGGWEHYLEALRSEEKRRRNVIDELMLTEWAFWIMMSVLHVAAFFYFAHQAYGAPAPETASAAATREAGLPSSGPRIRFAQVTDPHLFDSKNRPNKDRRPENERALRWAIEEINRRNALGPAYDFVAFTGDLGLEKEFEDPLRTLGLTTDHEHLDEALEKAFEPRTGVLRTIARRAAAEFHLFLKGSDVRVWLMVPGNNDLIGEDPRTIRCFHAFVEELQRAAGAHKEIIDLAPAGTSRPRLALDTCQFLGLDNASFKNNDRPRTAETFQPAQQGLLDDLEARIVPSKAGEKEQKLPFTFVFCHIPDVDDPYQASLSPEEFRKQYSQKVNGSFPRSAWTVAPAVRERWHAILGRKDVRRVFAGHFHASERWRYSDLHWVHELEAARDPKEGRHPAASLEKVIVCPPLAVKNQLDKAERARGFRDVVIDGKTGNVAADVVWLDDTLSTPPVLVHGGEERPPSRVGQPASPIMSWSWRAIALLGIALVGWGLVLLVVSPGAMTPRKQAFVFLAGTVAFTATAGLVALLVIG